MKDSLENEMTAEGLFLQKYGNKITGSESWVIRFAEDYATLKTSPLVQQLEEANFKLQDWYDTSKAVLSESCPQDEKHCACVPFLKREVKEVRKQNSILSKTVSDLMSQTLPEMYIKACDDRDEYREQLEKLQEENKHLHGEMFAGHPYYYKKWEKTQEENTLLKSQLEEANAQLEVQEILNIERRAEREALKKKLEEKDREIERLKQTISIMEDFNQENN